MNAPSFLQCKCQALLKCVEPYVFPSFFLTHCFEHFLLQLLNQRLNTAHYLYIYTII